jgi:NAD(P)H-dependent FMN reductase
MSNTQSILAFSGSTRSDSLNKKTLAIAVEAAREKGAEVTTVDLRDFPLPLYDGDLEDADGVPDNAMQLKTLFKANRGLLIATPEYNTSVSGVLKNAIDWVTRPVEGEPHLACFNGKIAGLLSASLGPMGGIRSQAHLRQILEGIGVIVIPEHWGVPGATAKSFNEDGSLCDETGQAMVRRVGVSLAGFLGRLTQ